MAWLFLLRSYMVRRLLIIAAWVLCIDGANCSNGISDDGLQVPNIPQDIPQDKEQVPGDGLQVLNVPQDKEQVPGDGLPFPNGLQVMDSLFIDEEQIPVHYYVLKKEDDLWWIVGGVVEFLRRKGVMSRRNKVPQHLWSMFLKADLKVDSKGVYIGEESRLTNGETAALVQAIRDIMEIAKEESCRKWAEGGGGAALSFVNRIKFVFKAKPYEVIKLVKDHAIEMKLYKRKVLREKTKSCPYWYGCIEYPSGEDIAPNAILHILDPEAYGPNPNLYMPIEDLTDDIEDLTDDIEDLTDDREDL
jgi:hypothetical protein